MNSYELSRNWFDWCFDNASKIKPIHSALFFFMIEHNNRLGWKKEFGIPRNMAMDAIGVKNNRTFTSAFNDLEEWGFIVVMERSKNQHSANIISLSASVKNTPATTKALDKAMQKHSQKQSIGTAPINKPINKETYIYKNGLIETTDELKNIEVDTSDSIGSHAKQLKEDLEILKHEEAEKYDEETFLKNWGLCRETYLKQPTHIHKLKPFERSNFDEAVRDYGKEKINKALLGLFKQENITIKSMTLQPKHFLENVDKYYQAELSKEYKLYGSKPMEKQQ